MRENKEERGKRIFDLTQECSKEILKQKAFEIATMLKNHNDRQYLEKDLFNAIKDGILKAERDGKEITYIHIFVLRSGIITGTYEFMVSLYDERYYLDRNPINCYFRPDFLVKDIDILFETVKENINRKVIRASRMELDRAKVLFVLLFYFLYAKTILFMTKDILELEEVRKKMNAGSLVINMGEYMGESIELYSNMKQDEE